MVSSSGVQFSILRLQHGLGPSRLQGEGLSFSAGAMQKTIPGYGGGETKQGSERGQH